MNNKKLHITTTVDMLTPTLIMIRRFDDISVKALNNEGTSFEVTCVSDDKGGLEVVKEWADEVVARSPLSPSAFPVARITDV